MHVRTEHGDLVLDRNGVTFRPFTLHGKQTATTWPWSEVRRVTVGDAGRQHDAQSKAWLVYAPLLRARQVAVIVSLAEEDLTFLTRQRLPELRAQAARVADDVPEARVDVA